MDKKCDRIRDARQKPRFNVLNRIDELRADRQLSEYALAKAAGMPQSAFVAWRKTKVNANGEKEAAVTPSLTAIERVCDALGISLSEFFSESRETPPSADAMQEKHLLSLWGRLSPAQRTIVLSLLETYLSIAATQ